MQIINIANSGSRDCNMIGVAADTSIHPQDATARILIGKEEPRLAVSGGRNPPAGQ